MHACEVAVEADITRVLIPLDSRGTSRRSACRAPTCVSIGGRCSGEQLSRIDAATIRDAAARIGTELAGDLSFADNVSDEHVTISFSVAMRYVGQDHTLLVPGQLGDEGNPSDASPLVELRRGFTPNTYDATTATSTMRLTSRWSRSK